MFRRLARTGAAIGSQALESDAIHHRSDAITSLSAFVGISIALIGGPGYETADDWAALLAAAVIGANGAILLRPAIHDLMDRMPERPVLERIAAVAAGVEGVRAIEKLRVRKVGMEYFVDLHVQADESMPLQEAHVLSGKVKGAIRAAVGDVAGVLIHMEPYQASERAEADHASSTRA